MNVFVCVFLGEREGLTSLLAVTLRSRGFFFGFFVPGVLALAYRVGARKSALNWCMESAPLNPNPWAAHRL